MKNSIVVVGMLLIAFIFISCEGPYVASEPVYIESARPAAPGPNHIWIEGDWYYNRQLHAYNRKEGHWDKPRPGHSFNQGHWESNKKGHHWIGGKWN